MKDRRDKWLTLIDVILYMGGCLDALTHRSFVKKNKHDAEKSGQTKFVYLTQQRNPNKLLSRKRIIMNSCVDLSWKFLETNVSWLIAFLLMVLILCSRRPLETTDERFVIDPCLRTSVASSSQNKATLTLPLALSLSSLSYFTLSTAFASKINTQTCSQKREKS